MAESVLVTGGAGFIGSNLVDRLLAEGRRVVAVDDLSQGSLGNLADARANHPGAFEFHRLDVTTDALDAVVQRHRPSVIFHLAAQMNVRVSVEDPIHDATSNVIGTVRVLEAARKYGVRKVTFATSGGCIYGEPALEDLPVNEQQPGFAHSPYGASKRCAEEYLRTYQVLHGVAWTSLALSNVFGPRQDPQGEAGVVAIFMERQLAGQQCTIFGDGEQSRDFVYVDDVVDAFARTVTKGDGDRCNIGTARRTSVNQLHAAIAAATGTPHDPLYAPARAGELLHNSVDPTLAGDVLGWSPFTSLASGLTSTLAWAKGRDL
jgi:UDP-glucose 4-epimerase